MSSESEFWAGAAEGLEAAARRIEEFEAKIGWTPEHERVLTDLLSAEIGGKVNLGGTMSRYANYDVKGECEVLHLGYPARGEILSTRDTEKGIAAYVAWSNGAGWLFRARPDGLPDQWRRDDA